MFHWQGSGPPSPNLGATFGFLFTLYARFCGLPPIVQRTHNRWGTGVLLPMGREYLFVVRELFGDFCAAGSQDPGNIEMFYVVGIRFWLWDILQVQRDWDVADGSSKLGP